MMIITTCRMGSHLDVRSQGRMIDDVKQAMVVGLIVFHGPHPSQLRDDFVF